MFIICCLGFILNSFSGVAALPNGTFGSLTFTTVSTVSMTLNWTNSSTNETGFLIYRSTDNKSFTYMGSSPADSTTYMATGLKANTLYYWLVYATNAEGTSSPVSASKTTNPAALKVPNRPVGLTYASWSQSSHWSPVGVPNEGDSVVIRAGDKVQMGTGASTCYALTIGQASGSVATLEFSGSSGSLVVTGGDLTINTTGRLWSSTVVTGGAYSISPRGNLVNGGVIDLSISGSKAVLLYNLLPNDQEFRCLSGSSTNLCQTSGSTGGWHISKEATSAKITFIPGGTFTIDGAANSGFLTLTRGTFEIAGSATFSNPVWSTATYTISSPAVFILNNTNATVAAQNGNAALNGKLTILAGTYNIGTAANHNLTGATSSNALQIDGGNLNISGKLNFRTSTNYIQSGGIVTVATQGNTADTLSSFGIGPSAASFTMSGGTIVLQNPSSVSNVTEYRISSLNTQLTGGTLQLGNAATNTFSDFDIQNVVFNLSFGTRAGGGVFTGKLSDSLTIVGTLLLANGKLNLADQTLYLNGQISGASSANNLSLNRFSSIFILGAGPVGTLFFDQTIPGTTNRLLNFWFRRTNQTITLGNMLEVSGYIIPLLGTLATGGNLTLVSDSSRTAGITSGTGNYITGNVKVQRYIQPVARRWRFLSSPVTGATLEDWRGEIFITGAGTGNTPGTLNSSGFDATPTNFPGAAWYNEANNKPNADSGWIFITNTTSSLTNVPLTVGRGYRVFVRGDRSSINRLNGTDMTQNAVTMELTGNVNTGDIVMPVSFTSSGTAAADGWSFLGNPYPAPIDWNMIHDPGRTGSSPNFSGNTYARIGPSVYVYDATANSYKGYNAVSNAGTLTDGIIPSGCSFFVQATAASPSLTLMESHKNTNRQVMYHKAAEEELYIRASVDSTNYDECVIKYSNGSTKGYDDHDMLKLFNADINIGTYRDSMHLLLDARPAGNEDDTFLLNISARATGEYSLAFSGMENFAAGHDIYLIDRFLGTVTDLRQTPTRLVKIDKNNASSEGYGRLMIVFKKNSSVGIAQVQQNHHAAALLYPTVTSGPVTISNSSLAGSRADVVVRDMTGRVVLSLRQASWNNNQLQIDLSACSPGIYLVELTDQTNTNPQVLKCIKQ